MIPDEFYGWVKTMPTQNFCFVESEKRDAVIVANKLRKEGFIVKVEKSVVFEYYFVVVKRNK